MDHVLAQACYRLVAVQRRRCFVCDSQISGVKVPKFLMDASSDLVLALRFVVVSCHSLGASYRLVAVLRHGGHERSGLGGVCLLEMSLLGSFRAGGGGGGGLWASSKTKDWWPGSRWGWGEYGVLTRPRSISPSLKKGMTRLDTI